MYPCARNEYVNGRLYDGTSPFGRAWSDTRALYVCPKRATRCIPEASGEGRGGGACANHPLAHTHGVCHTVRCRVMALKETTARRAVPRTWMMRRDLTTRNANLTRELYFLAVAAVDAEYRFHPRSSFQARCKDLRITMHFWALEHRSIDRSNGKKKKWRQVRSTESRHHFCLIKHARN